VLKVRYDEVMSSTCHKCNADGYLTWLRSAIQQPFNYKSFYFFRESDVLKMLVFKITKLSGFNR